MYLWQLYQLGYNAGNDKLMSNGFIPGTKEFTAWRQGWVNGRNDRRG